MSVFRCRLCSSPVQFMSTKFGNRRLFNATPVTIAEDITEDGWIPGPWKVGSTTRVVMAPIGHYGRDKRSRVRHVVLAHVCPAMLRDQESA